MAPSRIGPRHYKVEITILTSGARVPTLFRIQPYKPILSVLLYIVIHRRNYRLRTLLNDARAASRLFEWWEKAQTQRPSLDDLLLDGGVPSPGELAEFSRWLRLNPTRTSSTGSREAQDPPVLRATTMENYLVALKGFLLWCQGRYARNNKTGSSAFDTQFALEGVFKSITFKGRAPVAVRGLDHDQIRRLYAVLDVRCRDNPYRKHLRHRNYLIVSILHQTGLRRGELLKLTVDDIVVDRNDAAYIVVEFRSGDPSDSRRLEPGQKTLSRRLAILPELHKSILTYIRHFRRPLRDGKPIKLAHPYLFTSERGRPLSESEVNYIVARLGSAAHGKEVVLHPHLFRITFCIEMTDYLVDELGLDEEAAKDRLREYCGWTASSLMPERYTRKRIQREANLANIRRLTVARANYA